MQKTRQNVTVDQWIRFLNEWNAKWDYREGIYISYVSTNKKSQVGDIEMVELDHTKEGVEGIIPFGSNTPQLAA